MKEIKETEKDLKNHIKVLSQKTHNKEDDKKIQCFEVRNLYWDNEENIQKSKRILQDITYWKCAYAYINHDKDFYKENTFNENYELIGKVGEVKKKHTHLYVSLHTPKTIADIANSLGVKNTDIQKFKPTHFRNKILYLTHITYAPTEKTRYEVNEIHTNIKDYVEFVYSSYQPFYDVLSMCIEYMKSNKEKHITKTKFVELCILNDVSEDLRKNYNIIRDLITEHNQELDNNADFNDKLERERIKTKIERFKVSDMEEEQKQRNEQNKKIISLAKSFGCTEVQEEDGTIYTISIKENKKRK